MNLTPFVDNEKSQHLPSKEDWLMESEKRRKTYDRQLKVARDLGIDTKTLHHCKRELATEKSEAFPAKGVIRPKKRCSGARDGDWPRRRRSAKA
jgi:hypothetical protein